MFAHVDKLCEYYTHRKHVGTLDWLELFQNFPFQHNAFLCHSRWWAHCTFVPGKSHTDLSMSRAAVCFSFFSSTNIGWRKTQWLLYGNEITKYCSLLRVEYKNCGTNKTTWARLCVEWIFARFRHIQCDVCIDGNIHSFNSESSQQYFNSKMFWLTVLKDRKSTMDQLVAGVLDQ